MAKQVRSKNSRAYPVRFCSATVGRNKFPDILQDTFGDKGMTVFHRYGRSLGAMIPIEAVLMLAGHSDILDEEVRVCIEKTARKLLELNEQR